MITNTHMMTHYTVDRVDARSTVSAMSLLRYQISVVPQISVSV